MLLKKKLEHKLGCSQKTLRFLAKITRCGQASTYSRMDDGKDSVKKAKGSEVQTEEICKGKESYKTLASKEVREKRSKKKGWKRVRQAALASCRYMGMGAVHMNPAAFYASPEYSVDPKTWNKSFSSSYKPKNIPQTPHWTSNMMFLGW